MPDYGTPQGANAYAVRTNSIAFFAGDSTMLRIAFSGDSMFFTIIPKVADPNGGKPRWPKDMGHTAAFRPQTAMALYEGFKKTILPDVEMGRDHPGYCVVPLNREATTLAGFTYAGGHAIFTIFMNVAADRTCNEQYSFMFEPTTIVADYAPLNGSYKVLEVQAQLYVILEALRAFGVAPTNVYAHANKNATAWTTDSIISHLRAIAMRTGATPGQYGQYRGADGANFNYDGTSRFSDGPSPSSPTFQDNSGNTNWSTGYSAAATDGHTAMTPVNQVSSLEALMGAPVSDKTPADNDLPF